MFGQNQFQPRSYVGHLPGNEVESVQRRPIYRMYNRAFALGHHVTDFSLNYGIERKGYEEWK